MNMRLLAAEGLWSRAPSTCRLWFDGTRDLDVVGPAFMVNAVAGLVIAVLLVTWQHWVPLFLAVGFGVSTLGGVRDLHDGRAVRRQRVLVGLLRLGSSHRPRSW